MPDIIELATDTGERVFEFDRGRGMPPKKDIVSIRLNKGKNAILLKVGNDGGAYQFFYELSGLTPPLQWIDQGEVGTVVGNEKQFIVPASASSLFFRLKKP